MIDQELKRIWKGASSSERITINKTQLLNQLKDKMDKMDRNIKARDKREIYASVAGIVAFSLAAWDIPFILSKIACFFAIGWFIYVIYRLKKERKGEATDLNLSFRDQLEQRKQYIMGQSKMLKSVVYWYALPPFLMNLLLFLGAGNPDSADFFLSGIIPGSLVEKVIIVVFLGLFYGYIAWMNYSTAKKNLDPLVEQIEQTQRELKEE